MPDFIVHIGPHKTGSSYLQSSLSQLAGALSGAGVLYPDDLGHKGHELLPLELADAGQHGALAAKFDRYVQSGKAKIVLSSEDLSRLKTESIAVLRDMIGGHATRIVFYCRGWAQVSASQWNQRVKMGFATSLPEMLASYRDYPRRSGTLNYGKALGRWAEIFGRPALNLVSLEALGHAAIDTLQHFGATFLDLPSLQNSGRRRVIANRSLPVVDTEIVRALNQLRIERTGHRDGLMAKRFLRSRADLETGLIEDAAARCIETMMFDETQPKLTRLHRRLFQEYGDRLVPPGAHTGFFTPARREIAFVRPDYLLLPPVRAQLEQVYAMLSPASEPDAGGAVIG